MAAGRGASCTRRRKPRLLAARASDWRAASATYARRRRPAAQRRRSSATIDGLSSIIGDRIGDDDDDDELIDDLIQCERRHVPWWLRRCFASASAHRQTCVDIGIFIRWPTSRKRGYLHAGWQFSADQSSSRTSDLANTLALIKRNCGIIFLSIVSISINVD